MQLHLRSHCIHAHALLRFTHPKRPLNKVSDTLRIEWIYQQGAAMEFFGGAGELAEDQYAP
jgi:hypothetical protein